MSVDHKLLQNEIILIKKDTCATKKISGNEEFHLSCSFQKTFFPMRRHCTRMYKSLVFAPRTILLAMRESILMYLSKVKRHPSEILDKSFLMNGSKSNFDKTAFK